MKRRPGVAARSAKTAGRNAGAGAVRIIAGVWRHRLVTVPAAAGLRPTPNRVRETLFNWLGHAFGGDLSGRSALDLFAGSGALGFEAASRGAGPVLLVDADPTVVAQLHATRTALDAGQVNIRPGDGLGLAGQLVRGSARFDVVFLDPPFGHGLLADALPLAAALLTSDGYLYVEAETPLDPAALAASGVELYRADRAGEVFYHLLRRNIKE